MRVNLDRAQASFLVGDVRVLLGRQAFADARHGALLATVHAPKDLFTRRDGYATCTLFAHAQKVARTESLDNLFRTIHLRFIGGRDEDRAQSRVA